MCSLLLTAWLDHCRSKDGATKSCGLTLELVTLAREAVAAKPAWVRPPPCPAPAAARPPLRVPCSLPAVQSDGAPTRVIVPAGEPQINAVEKSATWLWQVRLRADGVTEPREPPRAAPSPARISSPSGSLALLPAGVARAARALGS